MEDEIQEESFGEEKIEADVKKTAKKKNPLFLIIGLVVVAVIAYFLVTGLVMPWLFPEKEAEEIAAQRKVEEPKEDVEFGVAHFIEEVTVNVKERNRSRYLMVDVGLELEKKKGNDGVKELIERDFQVKDIIRSILARLTYEKALDVAYEDTVKMEIMKELNKFLPENGKIRRVYFSKKVLQ